METIDLASLPIGDNDIVLDIGCGEGRHSIASHYYYPNAITIAVDLNFNDIHTAFSRHNAFNTEAKNAYLYVQADAFSLPFADNSVHHIICSEVLEHIQHYRHIIAEIKRVLKPDGSLSVSVPRAWPEKICWRLSRDYHEVEGGHVHIFNKVALQKTISNAHFLFQREHGAHALHVPYWWLRCFFWETQDSNTLVRLYHKLLVWDLMQKPRITQLIEKCLNPILGKSVVLYFLNKEQR